MTPSLEKIINRLMEIGWIEGTLLWRQKGGQKVRGIKWTEHGFKRFMAFGCLLAEIESREPLEAGTLRALRVLHNLESDRNKNRG